MKLGFRAHDGAPEPAQRRREPVVRVVAQSPGHRRDAGLLAGAGERIGQGRAISPCARKRRQRGRWRRIAAPLRGGQHAIGVGLLAQHEASVDPILGAAAQPSDDACGLQLDEAAFDAAFGDVGGAGDGLDARIEPPAGIMHEVEQQRVQGQQAVPADGAVLPIASSGLPLQPAGVMIELYGLALG